METTRNKTEPTFYDGRPIEAFAEDRLGRQAFARHLAEAITRHHGRESLVLAIDGPWGEGKTSAKSMIVDLLRQEHADRIVVLTFTPWEWSSQNQVAEAFFDEIAKQLELEDSSETAMSAANRLRALGRYLGLAGNLAGPAGFILDAALPGSSLLTIALGKGLNRAKELARDAAEDMEKQAAEARMALPQIKEELRRCLEMYREKEEKLLLVVIDDIDRLSPEEIRLVFQLVRVNADFPAIVFLLLYDEAFVVRALEKYFPESSRQFLEKIVQFQLSLPSLVENRLRDHAADELRTMVAHHPAYQPHLDIGRFNTFWADGLNSYIRNLRHAGRLLSSFAFHLGAFRSDDAEVNPLDLLVLEALRQFEPAVYRAIHRSADRLFPHFEILSEQEEDRRAWEETLDAMASVASQKEPCRRLLKHLFPRIFPKDRPFGPSPEDLQAANERRISHILYFHRYFRLTIDEDDIPDRQISELQNLFAEPQRFVERLDRLAGKGRLTLALTKLLARGTLTSSPRPVEMISRLCDLADGLAGSQVKSPSHHVSISDAMQQLVELQLPASLSSADRFERLRDGIEGSRAVHQPIQFAEGEDRRERHASKTDPRMRPEVGPHLTREDVQRLNAVVAERLEKALAAGAAELTPSWMRSLIWYLDFARDRASQNADQVVSNLNSIALLLRVIVNDTVMDDTDPSFEDAANTSLFRLKETVGFERFDRALEQHAAAIKAGGEDMSKRLAQYRAVRKLFGTQVESMRAARDDDR